MPARASLDSSCYRIANFYQHVAYTYACFLR